MKDFETENIYLVSVVFGFNQKTHLVIANNKEEVKDLLANAENAAKEFKEIEVSFFREDEENLYELPLVVVNNLIVSSASVLSEEELKEIFKNPGGYFEKRYY